MHYFNYGQTEIAYLSRRDKAIGALIREFGMIQRKVTPDVFESLVECIIGQQISNKAAATVYQRLKEFLGKTTPAAIGQTNVIVIQQCGTTSKKAHYIKDAADAILSGKINLREFNTLDDNEIIEQLTTLPGIGQWTAEMILLHALQRPNVFSSNDLIIRRSLMSLHNLSKLDATDFEMYRKRYSPYCSVAMIYLWKYGAQIK